MKCVIELSKSWKYFGKQQWVPLALGSPEPLRCRMDPRRPLLPSLNEKKRDAL